MLVIYTKIHSLWGDAWFSCPPLVPDYLCGPPTPHQDGHLECNVNPLIEVITGHWAPFYYHPQGLAVIGLHDFEISSKERKVLMKLASSDLRLTFLVIYSYDQVATHSRANAGVV